MYLIKPARLAAKLFLRYKGQEFDDMACHSSRREQIEWILERANEDDDLLFHFEDLDQEYGRELWYHLTQILL
jgi:hypothetical protein